ncbi:kinesin light chain 1 [Ophiobolus disseminans]|uniref:Kinesin light chain 1 n=1 Tax=Ophiobolus disseminans TaxID=1469910 RepID=A0A6A7A1E4_9PLEO|nr:kinesin light chain 1 [Ophiobolus disseminans]
MRLLKRLPGDSFELTSFDDERPPPYAILSHTWMEGQEVTFDELLAGTGHENGYAKLHFCGDRAAVDGLYKATNDELSTAIHSMFRWYQRANKCYVYLPDVSVPDEVGTAETCRTSWKQAFRRSRWFTRGWTLQELLAPASVEFFSREGARLGSRSSLELEIHDITKIPVDALSGQKLIEFSIEERMSWMAGRTTTIKEDKVYCLLGIFGVFLSLIYGEGEEHATLRLKEEIHKRQHAPVASPSIETSSSPLLFPRNELFSLLTSSSHRRMTVYGLGGCGKSALVLEFAYHALAERARDHVFWVPAISRESFELAYRDIVTRLRLPEYADPNTDTNKLVKEALSADSVGSWLNIVGNSDNPAILLRPVDSSPRFPRLADYLPHSRRGAVFFTTRSRKAATALTLGCTLELKDMARVEVKELLSQHITEEALLDFPMAVDKLLSILTYLPLAIVQAAAFINNNNISIPDYVSLFENAGTEIELFSEQFEDPSRYQEMDSTVAKTWHISFDQIRKQDPLAADCLSFIACIDRISIPQSLLSLGGSVVQQAKVLGTLTAYAFITERQQTMQAANRERFFDMHRLVHVASIAWLQEHNRLEELVLWSGHKGKEVWALYLPHAVHVAGHKDTVEATVAASLLDRVGWCQHYLGQYAAAEATHRQTSLLRNEVLGPEHPDILTSMNALAQVLKSQDKYQEAEMIHRQTLALWEKVLGREHPSTLLSTSNLALVLLWQGQYTEAEAMNRQALALSEKVLGGEHPDSLMNMNNLAQALNDQGKYEEAEEIYRQTLALSEKVLGRRHDITLSSMHNLALVLDNQSKYQEADAIHGQTLMLKKQVLGHEHPSTLMSVHNLAHHFAQTQLHRESLLLYQIAYTALQAVLGVDHPFTCSCHQRYVEAQQRASRE